MKEIKAYVKPAKLGAVVRELQKMEGLTGLSVMDVRGYGRGKARDAPHRIVDDLVSYLPRVKIEIFCRDELAEQVVSTIEKAAHTGLRGDGKIYVAAVEAAVRISTGDRGESAV